MSVDTIPLLSFGLSMLLFSILLIIIARLLGPSAPDARKNSTYECGEIPIGEGRTQFGMEYFHYAIYFVIFDVLTTFMLICATSFGFVSTQFIAPLLAFIGVVAVGSAYSWQLLRR